MGAVIPITSQAEVDAAWAEYQRLAQAERDDPTLSLDRAHVQARLLAHDRFQQLFLANERRTGNVVPIGGAA